MPYPVQTRDHALQSIVGAPIHAFQGIQSSPDRQNALEWSVRHDLHPVAIQTRVDATKRPTSQFSHIPALFQSIPDPWFADSRNRTIVGSPMLHSRAIPIRSADLDRGSADPKARSAHPKLLKKCSGSISNTEQMISEKFLIMISQYQNLSIMRTQYQKGPVFGSRT